MSPPVRTKRRIQADKAALAAAQEAAAQRTLFSG